MHNKYVYDWCDYKCIIQIWTPYTILRNIYMYSQMACEVIENHENIIQYKSEKVETDPSVPLFRPITLLFLYPGVTKEYTAFSSKFSR